MSYDVPSYLYHMYTYVHTSKLQVQLELEVELLIAWRESPLAPSRPLMPKVHLIWSLACDSHARLPRPAQRPAVLKHGLAHQLGGLPAIRRQLAHPHHLVH